MLCVANCSSARGRRGTGEVRIVSGVYYRYHGSFGALQSVRLQITLKIVFGVWFHRDQLRNVDGLDV